MLSLVALLALSDPVSVRVEQPRQQQLVVQAEELLRMAERLERQERHEDARQMLEALLDDPAPSVRGKARYRLALLDARRGETEAAIVTLRQLLAADPDHVEGRLTLASLLVQGGNERVALEELRLAMAGDLAPPMRDRVGSAIRQLTDRRPFAIDVRFAIAPDTNISGATDNEILETVIGDFSVSEQSKARSGIGVGVSGGVRYRTPLSETADWTVSVLGDANLYEDSDYRRVYAQVVTGPRIRFDRTRLSLGIGAGRYWLGGSPVFDQLQASASLEQLFGDDWLAQAGWTTRLISAHRNPLEEGARHRLSLGATHYLDPRTAISLQLSGERAALADPGFANRNWRASIAGSRHIGPFALGARAEIGGLKTDTRLTLFPDRRRDRYRRYEASLESRSWSVAGVLPFVRVVRERNHSTIAFYDYRRTRLEVGVAKID